VTTGIFSVFLFASTTRLWSRASSCAIWVSSILVKRGWGSDARFRNRMRGIADRMIFHLVIVAELLPALLGSNRHHRLDQDCQGFCDLDAVPDHLCRSSPVVLISFQGALVWM